MRRRFRKFNNQLACEEYKNLRLKIKEDIANALKIYLDRIQDGIIDDINKCWSYINSKRNNGGIPFHMTLVSMDPNDDQVIVDGFVSYYQDSYTSTSDIHLIPQNYLDNSFSYRHIDNFTASEISAAISRLKPKLT